MKKTKNRKITRVIENNQILLKEEQKKLDKHLYLEEHFEEVDKRIQDFKDKMEKRRNDKKVFLDFFQNDVYKFNIKNFIIYIRLKFKRGICAHFLILKITFSEILRKL